MFSKAATISELNDSIMGKILDNLDYPSDIHLVSKKFYALPRSSKAFLKFLKETGKDIKLDSFEKINIKFEDFEIPQFVEFLERNSRLNMLLFVLETKNAKVNNFVKVLNTAFGQKHLEMIEHLLVESQDEDPLTLKRRVKIVTKRITMSTLDQVDHVLIARYKENLNLYKSIAYLILNHEPIRQSMSLNDELYIECMFGNTKSMLRLINMAPDASEAKCFAAALLASNIEILKYFVDHGFESTKIMDELLPYVDEAAQRVVLWSPVMKRNLYLQNLNLLTFPIVLMLIVNDIIRGLVYRFMRK